MNVLILGGTGFISGSLTKKLLDKGCNVTLYTRGISGKKPADSPGLNYLYGDRRDARSLSNAVEGKTFDAVYDMIAYRAEESEAAADIFKNKTGRFIHCSTVSVYMISNEVTLPVTEDQDKLPVMEFFPRNPFGMGYGIYKRRCEEILWKNHDRKTFPVTMIRPVYVSGPGDPGRRDWFWIERILDGKPLLVPGTGEYKFQQVYVEDCAEAFSRALDTDAAIGEAYNVAAEEVFTLNEYLYTLAELLDKKIELRHIPQDKFDRLDISVSKQGDVFPFNTKRDAVMSLDKIKRDLNYSSTPFKKWMRETINWYVNNSGHSLGYEKREEELNIISSLKN